MTSGEKDDQPGHSDDSPSDEAADSSPTDSPAENEQDAQPESKSEDTVADTEAIDDEEEEVDESETIEEKEATDDDDEIGSDEEDGSTESVGLFDAEWGMEDESDEGSEEDNEAESELGEEDDETEDEKGEAEPVDSETDGGTVAEEETGGVLDGAPDDEEMPLTAHIEEMIKRLLAVIVVMGGVSLLVFPIAADIANHLWYNYLPAPDAGISACLDNPEEGGGACPRVYHPLGLLITRLKIASLAGFILALPVFVYQTYLFMRPGLYPQERRYYLASVPTSLVLALVGVAFAYFLILPFIFNYFMVYSAGVVGEGGIAFGLMETFDLILLMMGLFALVFQIPLFMMLAIMMGITTRLWLEDKRIIFWVVFAGVAFLFSPDPTGMAPLLVAITMIGLFELTLLLLRWTGR